MSGDHTEQFRRLREETEKALVRARRQRKKIGGAVNWADLGVVCCEFIVSDSEETYYRVTVEEVSPDARELCAFLETALLKAGLKAQVLSEW